MRSQDIGGRRRWLTALAMATIVSFAVLVSGSREAAAQDQQIVITITHIKALDKFDLFSKGDFYARVTIAGEVHKTPVAKQQTEINPNWVITQRVKSGKHDIRLEVFDKDISVDDPIDINRLDGKRPQDFTIDTKSCRITGFADAYRCGSTITRAGQEKKAAEISFKVEVKKP